MGHHRSRYRPPPPRGYDPYAGQAGGGYDPRYDRPQRRIPSIVILVALVVWTLLAWGALLLIDPLLAWAGAMVAPVLDVGTSVGGAVGLGKEVGGVIEASRAESIAQWLLGVLGWIAKPAIVIVWALVALAILLTPRLLSAGLLSRLRH